MKQQTKDKYWHLAFSKRPPHYHRNVPTVTLWSEKAACTNVTTWFLYHAGLLEKARAFHPWIHEYEWKVLKGKGYRVRLLDVMRKKNLPYVKFVREPFRRSVSSYLMLTTRSASISGNFASNTWDILRNHYVLGDDGGVSFYDFLRWITKTGPSVRTINGHFAQQYLEGEEILKPRIVHIEDMAVEIPKLEAELGLAPAPPEIYSSTTTHVHRYGRSEDCAAYRPLRAGNSEPLPSWRAFFDDQTEAMVKEIFAKDFKLYGYPQQLDAAPAKSRQRQFMLGWLPLRWFQRSD